VKAARTACLGTAAWDESIDAMVLMMAPLTPHIAEELWARRGGAYSIHQQRWPEFDPELAAEETFEMAVQVRGKVRDRLRVPVDISEDDAIKAALASDAVQRVLEGKTPKRLIYVPGRLVNVVV
jgi:leucyl-tRNA synthetase